MKIKTERDKRTYIIIALCAILVVMGAGYASFSSLLTINGTANISNSWCVGFDNTKTDTMHVTKGVSTGTEPTGTMSYSGTACGSNLQPNSSLNAHFYQPGDEIEYTLTITNKSTVAAAIKSILVDNESVTSNTTKKKGNITYVVEMPVDTTLAVNESTTMKVIARFQNETDVTGNVNGEVQSIEVKINAEQDDGNGGFTPTPVTPAETGYTGVLYSQSSDTISVGDSVMTQGWCGIGAEGDNSCSDYKVEYDSEGSCYDDDNLLCEQSGTRIISNIYSEEIPNGAYLKHNIVNGIVQSSEACLNDGNLSLCLKPKDFINNQNALNTSYDSNNCSLENGVYTCVQGSTRSKAEQSGTVTSENLGCGSGTSCQVSSPGSAHCFANEGMATC